MKRTTVTALLLCFCLLLSACGGAGTSDENKSGGAASAVPATPGADDTLVIAVPDDVEGCDVQQVGYTNVVHCLISEPLVAFNDDLTKVYPAFAESFEATDDYIEFVLPADAKFCNGDPLDAKAAKASVERYLMISDYAGDLDAVTSVEVVDERTLRYNLSGPAAYMWCALVSEFQCIVEESAAREMGSEAFNERPVTNGPYYVEEWVRGSHVTLRRNEYFKTSNPNVKTHGVANFGTIEVRVIPDENARLDALLSGDVDVVYGVPPDRYRELEANSAVSLERQLTPGVAYLNLQTDTGLLADLSVRQALTYAVDRDAIVDRLDHAVEASYGFITEAQTGYSAQMEAKLAETLKYDPERARSVLAEDGWVDSDGDGIVEKNGQALSVEMLIPLDHASFRAAGQLLREQFAAVGIDAQINEQSADEIKERMKQDRYDIGSRQYEWADADILYFLFTVESGYVWDDPTLTVALTLARQESNPERRVAAYAVASDLLAKDFKAISLYAENSLVAMKANISGISSIKTGNRWFNDALRS